MVTVPALSVTLTHGITWRSWSEAKYSTFVSERVCQWMPVGLPNSGPLPPTFRRRRTVYGLVALSERYPGIVRSRLPVCFSGQWQRSQVSLAGLRLWMGFGIGRGDESNVIPKSWRTPLIFAEMKRVAPSPTWQSTHETWACAWRP